VVTRTLLTMMTVLAACKGGDKDKGGGGTTGSKGGCESKAAKASELVTSKSVGMLAPLTNLSLGMSREDAMKACPNFFKGEDGKKTGNFSTGEIVAKFGEVYAQARLEFVGDKLDSVSFSVPPDILEALKASWGAPKVSSGEKPGHAWFDEAKKVRAIMGPPEYDNRSELTISSYMPLDAFLETDPARIAWKPQAVLGKLPADLAKTFPQYKKAVETSEAVKKQTAEMMKELDKEVAALGIDTKKDANLPEFELPPSPYEDGRATNVILHTDDDGTVRSYGVWFRTMSLSPAIGWPEQSGAIVKFLDEKWGAHKTVKETLGEEMRWHDPKLGIRASARMEKPEDFDLSFTKYFPIANFWGEPNGLWGFEKKERPLIGATPEEIQAAYKEYGVKHDKVSKTVTIYMPPTDYDGDSARTAILCFLRAGDKVGDYRFNLPYKEYEPAKAEYEAALLAKLGKPGKEKYGEIPYGKTTKVRWSDITKSLEVIVGEK